jgi:hypothetical protein
VLRTPKEASVSLRKANGSKTRVGLSSCDASLVFFHPFFVRHRRTYSCKSVDARDPIIYGRVIRRTI